MLKNMIVAVATTAAAGTATAQLSNVTVNRYVQSSVVGGANTDPLTTITGPASGEWMIDHFSSAVDGGNGGSGSGYQDSDASFGAYSAFIDASVDAFGDGTDLANSFALTHYEVDSSIIGSENYTLQGNVNAFGEINGEISEADIRLIDLSDNSVLHSWSVSDDFQTFNVAGSLATGDYKFIADAYSIVNRDFTGSFGNSTASVTFDMTITPEPQAFAILCLAGFRFAGQRRR